MDYIEQFHSRIESFMYSVNTYEHCMEYEFKTALQELELKENDILVNLGGGGLNIQKYTDCKIKYIAMDFSKEWCEYDKDLIYISYDNIPLKDNCVDKVIILALLHHFNNEERSKLYKECFRILKNTGKLVIADVKKNSQQDTWLNTIVDKYNPFGHKGIFFDKEDRNLLIEHNFHVEIKNKKYHWVFNDIEEMLDYMKNLFFLDISHDDLLNNIHNTFNVSIVDNKYYIDWELIYFICSIN